jgi:hypothetical protein
MATHDYNIANQIGSEFRADLNNALLAIVSNNSNATSPSTTYAYQLWVDTANNVLKLRNSANSDWITTGISITASNSFTGDITGNSATATALATARTINGVSFDGTANISFNTDSVSEGSSNKYFTNERVDDQVNSLLTAGSGISLTYDDAAGTLTIANTNSADITSVVAGDGLTGGGTSGDVTLAVSVDDSSIEINSDTLRVKASGVTNAMLAGSIANSKLANSSVTINSQAISLGGSHTFDSDDIGEGSSNLYFTNARARGSLSIGSEGSASGNGAIAYNSTTGVFTYTPPVISGLSGDTDDLSEGSSNLYYTDARANAAIDARVTNTFINNLSGVVADTSTALATARSIALSGDVTASGVNFDGTGDITLSTTIAANSVALGTDTTGNYVATVTGTTNEIEVSGSGSETASVTIGLPDNVTIAGNLTVNGTTTSVNTQTLEVEDPLIKLAKANSGADSVDIGFYGLYDTSGSQDLYAGLFRDASDSGKFKLFKDLQAEPTTTVNTSGTGYAVGTLVSNLEGDVTGTLQTAAQPNITSLGTLTGLTTTGDINLGDDDKVIFGAGSDLQIFHDGSHSRIKDAGTGNLTINATNLIINNSADTANMIKAIDGGAVNIYHNGSEKLATTSSGVDVTGTLDASSQVLVGTNDSIFAENNIRFKPSGGAFIDHNTTGQNINFRVSNSSSLDTTPLIISSSGITATLLTAAQPNITSVGTLSTLTVDDITINGSTISDGGDLTVDVTGVLNLDATTQIILKDDGTNYGTFYQSSSDFYIQSLVQDKDLVFYGNDGGSGITALTLDMSDAGAASFNSGATFGSHTRVNGDFSVSATSGEDRFAILPQSAGSGTIFFSGNEGLTGYEPLTMDFEDLRLRTSGTERMRIDSSGLVGIGTTSAKEKLDVSGAGVFTGNHATGTNAYGAAQGVMIHASSSTGFVTAVSNGSNDVDLQLRGLNGGTANANQLVLDSEGGVGIGTASPAVALDIAGSSTTQMRIQMSGQADTRVLSDTGTGIVGTYSNHPLTIKTNSSTVATFDASGNVGVGLTNPSAYGKFVIEGTATQLALNASSGKARVGFFEGGTGRFYIDTLNGSDGLAFVDADGSTERMRIDSSGNLGLGTASPTSYNSNGDNLVVAGSGNTGITIAAGTSDDNNIFFADGTSGDAAYRGIIRYNHSGDNFEFYTAATERMSIDSSGNVGIGDASPDNKLHINSGSDNINTKFESTDTEVRLQLKDSTGTSYIAARNDIRFGNDTSTERMRINNNGHVLIGTTTNQGVGGISFQYASSGVNIQQNSDSTSGGYEFYVFRRNSTQIGSINQSSTNAVTYNTSSDARLKDITGSSRGLEVINNLNPVAYNWKADNHADEGLIAQEVEELVPNAVNQDEDGYYSMDYSKLVTHLVKGMQEQQEQIESLKSEIANLKEK